VQGQQHDVVPDDRHDRGQDVTQDVAADPGQDRVAEQTDAGPAVPGKQPVARVFDLRQVGQEVDHQHQDDDRFERGADQYRPGVQHPTGGQRGAPGGLGFELVHQVELVVEPAQHGAVVVELLQVGRCLTGQLAGLFGQRGRRSGHEPCDARQREQRDHGDRERSA